ncbi:5-formyltetrahydrofolate cyclo-ligase [Parashewanella curva]|uniref:5-formyltetrahydrofolate cyclo-ligase n=1 Tax=Parashewanella curva TaxID=2338552 RepID=A0A3L8Q3X9_9GAMM|nr:5-formyltetrahydrofolate cyclo-ligase [Parashewanella curva]RLV61732.1 5-formyltetrahydrofolate cyclo-ligase [Parashewanella curva]
MDNTTVRNQLRQQIRKQRRALSQLQQQLFAEQASERLLSHLIETQSHSVALYLSFDGELDTTPLITKLWASGIKTYLPVLHPFTQGHLLFVEYQSSSPMKHNKFGIAEPVLACDKVLPVDQLDVIITPLVAFDEQGNRMGMGGGYYDRTLAYLESKNSIKIIGFAHDCQKVESLPVEAWDKPLSSVITPTLHHRF